MSEGRVFQMAGAATAKLRELQDVHCAWTWGTDTVTMCHWPFALRTMLSDDKWIVVYSSHPLGVCEPSAANMHVAAQNENVIFSSAILHYCEW